MYKYIFTIYFVTFGLLLAEPHNLNDLDYLIEHKQFSQAEQLLREKLKNKKNNEVLKFHLARILSWQKKYAAALVLYDELLSESPDNGDYKLGKAQTMFWSGQDKAALSILEQASEAEPLYKDIWKLQLVILQKAGDEESKNKIRFILAKLKKLFPDETWDNFGSEQDKLLGDVRYTEVEAGYNHENLNKGLDDWSSIFLAGEHQFKDFSKLYMSLTETKRFKITDYEYLIGYFSIINSKWNLLVDLSTSSTHKIRPKWSVFTQLQRSFKHGWNGYIGLRETDYNETDTHALSTVIERYWGNLRASYTLYATQVIAVATPADTFISHQFAVDYYYGNKNTLGFSINSGKELEYNGRINPPVSNIFSSVFKGRHWFAKNWAVSYNLSLHEQGDLYKRSGNQIGLRYRY